MASSVSTLLATLAVLIVFALAIGLGALVWRGWERIQREKLDIERRRLALEERRSPAEKERPPMPPELLAIVQQESAQWARDDALKAIYERYAETGDWKKVTVDVVNNASFARPWGNA